MFCKQRLDKANALGEINSKNRGVITGEKKRHKLAEFSKYSVQATTIGPPVTQFDKFS